ncbi:2-keto-4-pentenoate hydratase [Brevibacillus nitrificans]|uniref:2-keto-4-pentenoate hydratase n=1 Tax=Brevibacillus nitrificans TaxID=651560 RepID=UPI0026326A0F|nr:fumarylacetoacetate hydrolase family protein [Brevibacillus nitrificans]MED1794681.1 fumarylacetoacetate hydrolase family protein [Brevibacillus nitrificans]
MAMTTETKQDLVEWLLAAERDRREVEKITQRYPDMTIEDAYEIQRQLIANKEQAGERCIGLKLGLTSRAKQQMMGVHEAIYGYLTDGMLATEWETIAHERFIHPKAEPEIAFLMGEDLQGTNVTAKDVLRATRYVAPAIEIIDSRYENFRFTLPDVVADNCSSAAFVVGSRWVAPGSLDLALAGVVMTINGVIQTTGSGAAVLGHPATSVAWAVNKLGEQGSGLKKGQIILSGALTEAVLFQPGDVIQVSVDGMGSVSFGCQKSRNEI